MILLFGAPKNDELKLLTTALESAGELPDFECAPAGAGPRWSIIPETQEAAVEDQEIGNEFDPSLAVYEEDLGEESQQGLTPMEVIKFDVARVSELEDVASPTRKAQVSLLVAILEISDAKIVKTKLDHREVALVNLKVGDATKIPFQVSVFGENTSWLHNLRVMDIVLLENLGLSEYRGVVSAVTRKSSKCNLVYRTNRLGHQDNQWRPPLHYRDEATRKVGEIRDWLLTFVGNRRDNDLPNDTPA